MTDHMTEGRTRWLDPDSPTVTAALQAYHCTEQAWKQPWRTRHGENRERFQMALALETALADPRGSRITWLVRITETWDEGSHTVWTLAEPRQVKRAIYPNQGRRFEVGDFVTRGGIDHDWQVIDVRHTNPLKRTLDLVVREAA